MVGTLKGLSRLAAMAGTLTICCGYGGHTNRFFAVMAGTLTFVVPMGPWGMLTGLSRLCQVGSAMVGTLTGLCLSRLW